VNKSNFTCIKNAERFKPQPKQSSLLWVTSKSCHPLLL